MCVHAFSLRDGWGRLLEKQGVVQETSREARAPMAGEPRPTILGERHGARHRGLRSGRGTGPSAKRRACLGERREVAPPRGPESVGTGSRGAGRRRSLCFGCGCDRRGRAGPAVLGHRVETQRGLVEGPRPTQGLDRGGCQAVEATATRTSTGARGPSDRLERRDGTNLERIITVETISLAPVIREEDDAGVAFSAPGRAVASVGNAP